MLDLGLLLVFMVILNNIKNYDYAKQELFRSLKYTFY